MSSLPGLGSEISASISRSSARYVEVRSIPFICSEKRTTACALRKILGTVVVDVSPIGGRCDRSASNIESDSSISRRCSTTCLSSGRMGISWACAQRAVRSFLGRWRTGCTMLVGNSSLRDRDRTKMWTCKCVAPEVQYLAGGDRH